MLHMDVRMPRRPGRAVGSLLIGDLLCPSRNDEENKAFGVHVLLRGSRPTVQVSFHGWTGEGCLSPEGEFASRRIFDSFDPSKEYSVNAT